MLVVEDNEADVFLIEQACLENGLGVVLKRFRDGESAREYLQFLATESDEACPCLIVLDLNLPGVNGHDLLYLIRNSNICKRTPVAVLTSSTALTDRRQALNLGADRFLTKPADLDEFIKLGVVFRELIENRRTA